jgi:hypothetical protein
MVIYMSEYELQQQYNQSLVIGRFQPLCKNHENLFAQAAGSGEHLLVGVGTPNYSRAKDVLDKTQFAKYQLQYPYDFETVSGWIKQVTNHLPVSSTTIVPIKDIFDTQNYARHVGSSFLDKGISLEDTVLVGENESTYSCFKETMIPIQVAKDETGFHATQVRKELSTTGKSNRLAVALSPSQIKTIQRYETLKDKLVEGSSISYIGHVSMMKVPGKTHDFDVVVSPKAAKILYVDTNNQAWFVRQHRKPVNGAILELPAETIDKPGKSSMEHIIAGLHEECGILVPENQVEFISSIYSSPGHDTEEVDLFIAKGDHIQVGQQLEPEEDIDIVKMNIQDAYKATLDGRIKDGNAGMLIREYMLRTMGEKK